MLNEIATVDERSGEKECREHSHDEQCGGNMAMKYEIITHGVFGVCYCCNFFMTLQSFMGSSIHIRFRLMQRTGLRADATR